MERLWYQMYRARGVGTKSLHRIFEAVQSGALDINSISDLPFAELQNKTGLSSAACLELSEIGKDSHFNTEFEELKSKGCEVLHLQHQEYPALVYQRLKNESPPIIFCLGDTALLNTPSVTIAGSRSASERSVALAKEISRRLAKAGKNIVAGYARGVDNAAHLGALEAGGSTTIVLSLGIHHFEKKGDFNRLNEGGRFLAISQFHPYEVWRGRNAMARSRLSVALSQAVVIVECGPRIDPDNEKLSGTFHTGETALELGIPLFVISPEEVPATAVGNAELIKMGGVEVTGEEVLERIISIC